MIDTMPRIAGRRRSPRSPAWPGASGRRTWRAGWASACASSAWRLRLSQRQVAARVGISQTDYEPPRAVAAGPGPASMCWAACAAALGLQLAAFFERDAGRGPAAGHRAPATAEPDRRDGAGRRLDGDPGGDGRRGTLVAVDRRAAGPRRASRGGGRSRSGTSCSTAARRCAASTAKVAGAAGAARARVAGSGPARRSRDPSEPAPSSASCGRCLRRATRHRPRRGCAR